MTTIRVGNAPCSWGSLEFEGLGGQPLTCERMLDELVETGYTGTELGDWGFMPTESAALRNVLEARGVTMVGAFVPVRRMLLAHAAGADAPYGWRGSWQARHRGACAHDHPRR